MDVRLSRHRAPRRSRRDLIPGLLPGLVLAFSLLLPVAALAQNASITLHWTAPGDDGNTGTATSYQVRMSQASISESNWSNATLLPNAPTPLPAGTQQSITVNGLTQGTTYYFAIKAIDDAGNVAPISNVVRWDWTLDTAPPAAPTGLSTSVEGNVVTLNWSANSEADLAGYNVYRALAATGPYDPIAAGVTSTDYVDTGIPGGTAAVWYRVTASDQSGNESSLSAIASATLATATAPAGSFTLRPAYPNPGPVGSSVSLPMDVPPAGAGSAYLRIMDSGGHLVRRIDLSGVGGGPQTITWDGRNYAGRPVSPGVYTAWLIGGGSTKSLKIVRVP